MKLRALFAVSLLSLSAVACAVDAGGVDQDGVDAEDTATSEGELSSVARKLVGRFGWDAAGDAPYLDMERIYLNADGTYAARVEAGYVNPAVRCVRAPCTLDEEGRWNGYNVSGKLRLRLSPKGGKVRIYGAAVSPASLDLTRFGGSTSLARESSNTCANVRCTSGTHCEDGNGTQPPQCVPDVNPCAFTLCAANSTCEVENGQAVCKPLPVDPPAGKCVKTGCSGHVCADQPMFTTCEFRPEYACYQAAICERGTDGKCGFRQTAELTSCLGSNGAN